MGLACYLPRPPSLTKLTSMVRYYRRGNSSHCCGMSEARVYRWMTVQGLADAALEALGAGCPALRFLGAYYCDRITNRGLPSHRGCPAFKRFNLQGSRELRLGPSPPMSPNGAAPPASSLPMSDDSGGRAANLARPVFYIGRATCEHSVRRRTAETKTAGTPAPRSPRPRAAREGH